jgi:hypothetical protein
MACRRVLSSTPLLVRGSETYKQEIQLVQVARIGKKVVGPVSKLAPLDWRLGECTHQAEWTPFQTHCFPAKLVVPGIEPGPLDL